MEELDLLKKAWKRNQAFDNVSEQEIYAMLHKRSSSIVKWIVIISVLEILLWTVIGLCLNREDETMKNAPAWLMTVYTVFNYVNYAVVIAFIFLFYKNYRAISTTESTRKLMSDILRTRRTVKWYVGAQLAMAVVGLVLGLILAYNYNPQTAIIRNFLHEEQHEGWAVVFALAALAFIAAAIGIFWLFYRLLYGIQLRKLYRNYNELKRIDKL